MTSSENHGDLWYTLEIFKELVSKYINNLDIYKANILTYKKEHTKFIT